MNRFDIVLAFNLHQELEQKKTEQRKASLRLVDLPGEIDAIERRLNELGLPALPIPAR